MLIKVVVSFVALLQISYGYPMETAQALYNTKFFQSPRIVGGVDAPDGHSKHMVALVAGRLFKSLVCGASIITNRCILTAAHCIEPFVFQGIFWRTLNGAAGSNSWFYRTTEIKFSGYKMHPGWNSITIKNDTGLLYAAEPIKFTDKIGPISLYYKKIFGGELSFATGWGLADVTSQVSLEIPDRLQLLYVKTLDHEDCSRRIEASGVDWEGVPPVDPEIEICTFHSVGHGMCNGDSGSALVLDSLGVQIGVVSWGFACALGYPDVFARISGFREFIESNIGEKA